MKAQRFLLQCLLLAFLGFGFWGCEKETIVTHEDSTEETALILQVTQISQNYCTSIEASAQRGGPLLAKLGADLKGALRGFVDGYEIPIGGHGGHVTIYGLGGAILNGIAASQAVAGLNPGSTGGPATHHPGNEFDHVGALHYSIMDDIYANANVYFHANGTVNFPAYYALVMERLEASGILAEDEEALFPVVELQSHHAEFLGNESILAYSNGLNHPQFLPSERAILGQYFGALIASHDIEAFAEYSIAVENAVTASTLPTKSKALLLVEMATARHGAAYWN